PGQWHLLHPGRRRDRLARVHHRLVTGHHAGHVVADLLDVIRGRAAAPAHDPGPGLDHATGVARHVLRAREVDLAVAHVLGEAGVGYGRDGSIGGLHELLDRLEHARRPDQIGRAHV